MNSIKFNEWSDMGQKKDIETINKKLDSREPIFLSICIEIVIAVGVVLVNHLFDTDQTPVLVWIITGIIAVMPPVFFIIRALYKYICRIVNVWNGKLNTVDYIDTFDNSICYWAMMCRSFCNLLKDKGTKISNDEKMFYYQEASYYIFKSIYNLDKMTPVVNKVFTIDAKESINKHVITIYRLETIVNVLKTVSKELELELTNISGYDDSKLQQIELRKSYNKMMESFIDSINESFSCNLTWIKDNS